MKFVPSFVLVALLMTQVASSRPVKKDEDFGSNIYITGNIRNAALSHSYSKSQAVSDRENSEWNNTQMNKNVYRNVPISQTDENKERNGLLIYAGGNAANLALAFSGSESQAAENDQKSGYNTQNMGLQSGIEATEYEDDQKNE